MLPNAAVADVDLTLNILHQSLPEAPPASDIIQDSDIPVIT